MSKYDPLSLPLPQGNVVDPNADGASVQPQQDHQGIQGKQSDRDFDKIKAKVDQMAVDLSKAKTDILRLQDEDSSILPADPVYPITAPGVCCFTASFHVGEFSEEALGLLVGFSTPQLVNPNYVVSGGNTITIKQPGNYFFIASGYVTVVKGNPENLAFLLRKVSLSNLTQRDCWVSAFYGTGGSSETFYLPVILSSIFNQAADGPFQLLAKCGQSPTGGGAGMDGYLTIMGPLDDLTQIVDA